MKTEALVFWFIGAFFLVVTPVYWFMSGEVIGTVALAFTFVLGVMIASFLQYEAKHFDARPEDRLDATIEEAAGPYGFFPPKSIWPFWCALVISVILLGPSFEQWWISMIGFGLGIWAVSGWILEFYRGDYRH
ncbi:cytochrome c oxidase subunit 4 [Tessaracoccus sp. OH4464_COT-324]|uniref:cytochrome c oxidase subunit 4 n=1 Tax=Tessaracoccus sp. OH4464_COT-324 TaxID=2491059 RepID=UPI000F62EBC2|nr:cytochrome c oxidase subunit 4 [Tessaracoccus sp. OH4464_COT-324]RRD45759.1 cytochrome c oxidase subunit 4 [Tessaracoccus sp. OH4464_COT-324]